MRLAITGILNAFFIVVSLAVASSPAQAEDSSTMILKTISYENDLETDETLRKTELDQTEAQILDPLVKEGFRAESTPAAVIVESTVYYYEGDISIFDAWTTLISDFDDDGFFHRFSVSIDADTVFSDAWVYAELYLSYEGGPWNYFATSSDFPIHGDSEFDVFVVESELADGFPTGYYDVRIELYDAETGDWVQSYGPYDDASLSALPLEDSYHDEDHQSVTLTTQVIVDGHGHGSLGLLMIAAFSLVGLLRRLTVMHSSVARGQGLGSGIRSS